MKLYVGNLSKTLTDDELHELVSPFGVPTSVRIVTEFKTGESKGFGFVEFSNEDEAKAAITGLNGKEIYGHVLKVDALPGTEDGDDH